MKHPILGISLSLIIFLFSIPPANALSEELEFTISIDFPYGVATDSENKIFVADPLSDNINIFDSTGSFLSTINNSTITPSALSIDTSDRIIVADGRTGVTKVHVLDSDGTWLFEINFDDDQQPRDVTTDSNDRIIVAVTDTDVSETYIFAANGTFQFTTENTVGESPSGVATDSNDRIIVADDGNDQIHVYSSGGELDFTIDEVNPGTPFVSPNGVATDSNDRIIVMDSDNNPTSGKHAIYIFDSEGTFLDSLVYSALESVKLSAITTDSNDRIIVAVTDTKQHAVKVYGFPPVTITDNLSIVDTVTVQKITNEDAVAPSCPQPFSSFLGGTRNDFGFNIVEDSAGNIFAVMDTKSTDVIGTSCGEFTSNAGDEDLVILKLDSSLNNVLKATYFGGTEGELDAYIAIDDSDNIFVTSRTGSDDIPKSTGGQPSHAGSENREMMIVKFDNDLNVIVSTYLGGTGKEFPSGIIVDDSNNVFVSGRTTSTNFPNATNGAQTSNAGGADLFLTKFDNNLSNSYNSTYFGTSGNEFNGGLAIDSNNVLFMSGRTNGAAIPSVTNGYQSTISGLGDAFVVSVSNDLGTFNQSTYIGGTRCENTRGIGIDNSDNVFVIGVTSSDDFPGTTDGAQPERSNTGTQAGCIDTPRDGQDLFITKFDNGLQESQSTYLGGTGNEEVLAGFIIEFDSSDNVYVGGNTKSTDFPNTGSGFQSSHGGGVLDVFITKLNNELTTNIVSSYIGGSKPDTKIGGLLVTTHGVYVHFESLSTTIPNIPGTSFGVYDTVIIKLDSTLANIVNDDPIEDSEEPIEDPVVPDTSPEEETLVIKEKSFYIEKSGVTIFEIKNWVSSEKNFGAGINHLVVIGFIDAKKISSNSNPPEWVIGVAELWQTNQITDEEYYHTIEYLIENNIVN